MTESQIQHLLRRCPTLFHMAERGAWPSICAHGLLSTAALLDLYRVANREPVEAQHRPAGVPLAAPGLPGALVRDQKPMSDRALERCLGGGMTPAEWYRLLNGKVFFWLTEERLRRLLDARPYRAAEHDVLEIDGARLVAAYRHAITLSPINSGTTFRKPALRGPDTFQSIDAYADRRPVVELAVTYAVPDIARFVTRVTRRRGGESLSRLWP